MTPNSASPTKPPAHVPPELFWDHDISQFPGQFEDPYVGLAKAMYQGPDIVWARGAHAGQPGWLLTRVAHQQEVFMDPVQFPSAFNRTVSALLGNDLALLPSESDPPDHRFYRAIIQPWFIPSAINALDQRVRQICDELMGKFAARKSCEFVTELGSLLPSYIFLEIMGMPREQLPQFLEWEDTFIRGTSIQQRVNAVREVYAYLQGYAEERRRNPGSDLVSKIVFSQVNKRPITEKEALGLCMTLYLGGLDTVANSLSWQIRHLAKDQALQEQLRTHPELLPAAIDEMLRLYGVTGTHRSVADDMDFHGAPFRKGDLISMPHFLASRDDRVFSDPHSLKLDRRERNMSFGTGIHNCVGIHLAKREIRVVLAEFLTRFKHIRIQEGQKEILSTLGVWGVKKLPLAWD